jgi:hypothetical protein
MVTAEILRERIARIPDGETGIANFAPLRQLKLKPGTELYLRLLHMTDGIEGARKRISAQKPPSITLESAPSAACAGRTPRP